jgi:ATP-dependent DNA helicase RecG
MEKALKEFEKIPEIIPEPIRKKINIPGINKALNQIHFPENKESIKKAKKRFSFESLFILQLSNFQKRYTLSKEKAPVIKVDEKKVKKIKGYLPFKLTKDQKKVLDEILNDIQKDYPMNRLLQGDVGSGKTVIAAIISIIAAQNDFQTAFMAPTEILAQQHYETFKKFFEETDIGIALLTSDELKIFFSNGLESNPNKKTLLEKIKKNNIKIVIGTHALIQKNVTFSKLGLVIIDEQHRFGVEQRAKLTKNIKLLPHFLSMTATPIPRTLAITAFGDLNISLITELPKNRKPITTKIVPPSNRKKAYQFIRQEIKKGRQAFVICPRIEPSENNTEKSEDKRKTAWDDVKAVKEEYKKLSQKVFPNLKVEMLHGKLKSEEKEKVMKGFAEGKTNILVSTSVVEIGIDIPNATIMMIEGADRFGLAQLYQFKGRVGRGEHQSYCLLFSDSNSPQIKNRMWSIIKAKNGFELAEKDLKLRGPGEFLGKSQTGIPDIAMESFQNLKLVKESREAAKETIKKDRQLEKHLELKNRVKELGEKIHRE